MPLLAAACTAYAQAPVEAGLPPGMRVIELKGRIVPSLVPKIRGVLESAEPERVPAGAVIVLDSSGGDGLAAIELGKMVRAAKAHVFVRGRCASACVYILAGGVVRGVARDRAVGIHSPRLTGFVQGLGVVDINAASNPKAAAALAAGNKRSREYFNAMGFSDTLFDAMTATPSDQTRYLDLAELPGLGLTGFDPAYLAEHAPAAAKRYNVSEDEYARRTLATPAICLAESAVAKEFARCYLRVLRIGE